MAVPAADDRPPPADRAAGRAQYAAADRAHPAPGVCRGERRAVSDVLLAAAVAAFRAHLAVRVHRLPRRADDCLHAAPAEGWSWRAHAAGRSELCVGRFLVLARAAGCRIVPV